MSKREVLVFDTLDDAQRDVRLRGACIVLDAHFRFWSTPTELTLIEIHTQIFRRLCADLDEPPHPIDVVISTSPTVGQPPSCTCTITNWERIEDPACPVHRKAA